MIRTELLLIILQTVRAIRFVNSKLTHYVIIQTSTVFFMSNL